MLILKEVCKKGFNEKLSVGEMLTIDNEKYIVIEILNTRMTYSQMIYCEVILQNVNELLDYSEYKQFGQHTTRYNIAKTKAEFRKIGSVGQVKLRKGNALVKVTSIESFEYEFTDLVVLYNFEFIQPWKKHEIDKAVKANRLSTFKVVK